MEMNAKPQHTNAIWGTLVTLFIPAITYYCAYNYEVGYCGYFGISSDLISPDLQSYVKMFLGMLFLFFFAYVIPQILINLILKKQIDKRPYLSPLFIAVSIYIPIIITLFIFEPIQHISIIPIVIFLGFDLYIHLREAGYIYSQLKKSRSLKEIYKDFEIEIPFISYPDAFKISSFLGKDKKRSLMLIIWLFVVASFCKSFGGLSAINQNTFYISSLHKNYILVRKLGDELYFKSYNPENKQIGDSLIIDNIGSKHQEVLIKKRLGKFINDNINSNKY